MLLIRENNPKTDAPLTDAGIEEGIANGIKALMQKSYMVIIVWKNYASNNI